MKRLILLFTVLGSIAAAGELQDGRYSVRTDRSIWFWYPRTEIVVRNGRVTEAFHDRVKKDGRLASEDDKYNKRMLKKTGSNPERYSKDIPESYFRAGGDLVGMDSVAGATDSTNHFKKQMEFLLKKAEAGETGEHIMPKKDIQ